MKKEFLPELWEITLSFLYTEEYVKELIQFFKNENTQIILDCACGVGFPSINLKKAGFDVYATDSSESIVQIFKKKCRDHEVKIPHQVLDWEDLGRLDKKFDAVMCRGNSFVYLDSWEKDLIDTENFFEKAQKSLRSMRQVLKPDGFLYIDMPSQKEYAQGPDFVEELGERSIEGKMTNIKWMVHHDWKKRIRTIVSERKVDAEVFTHTYESFLLKHSEMVELLKSVGFLRIENILFQGENNYSVFICRQTQNSRSV